jgi:hypothetical protein
MPKAKARRHSRDRNNGAPFRSRGSRRRVDGGHAARGWHPPRLGFDGHVPDDDPSVDAAPPLYAGRAAATREEPEASSGPHARTDGQRKRRRRARAARRAAYAAQLEREAANRAAFEATRVTVPGPVCCTCLAPLGPDTHWPLLCPSCLVRDEAVG